MAELEELLEGMDEDQAEALREYVAGKEAEADSVKAEATKASRALRFAQDQDLYKKFPRVVANVREGNIDASGIPDDKLDEFLTSEESRLAKMGVPLPGEPLSDPAVQGEKPPAQQQQAPTPPPAEGWGRPVATGGAAPPNPSAAISEAMNQGSISDVLKAIHSAADGDPRFRGPTGMDEVVAPFESRLPIRSS